MPGAEFRVANQECLKVPGCNMVLGDRRLSLTISRMFRLMSPWEKCKFILSMLWDSVSTVRVNSEKFQKFDFQENQSMLRVFRFFEKMPFLSKIPFFDENFREKKPSIESH